MFLADNLSVNKSGNLTFADMDTVELAKQYGTPLYLMDEDRIRAKCRMYKALADKYFDNAKILYASKASSFVRMYEIINEEELCVDVVSGGELYASLKAGFPAERIYFHGNNKSFEEIDYAIKSGVGYFVADNPYELCNINKISGKYSITQKVILRLNPGIDPHTFEAVATGKVDSKFGVAIETGQAKEFVKLALTCKNIALEGYHCHIGSQLFDHKLFCDSAKVMIKFSGDVKAITGYEPSVLNLGGGFGIRYVEADDKPDIEETVKMLADTIKTECLSYGLKHPEILLEPGRSIVGDSGITLYTVGSVKEITGYKKYVAVDGGMSDNPRYALYGAPYTIEIANKVLRDKNYTCTVVGKCCESGDIIQENVKIPHPSQGDILAVLCTGAYNYTMASNYNKIPKPPVVMVSKGKAYTAVKRESYEDLIHNEI